MRRWLFPIAGVVCLFAAIGCSHVHDYLDIAREKGMSGEYLAVLKQWTRSKIIYSQFETKAHISATYRSAEFNRVYLREYNRIYHLREEELKAREGALAAMSYDVTEFLFYAYIPEKSSNDFDRRGSIWNVFLVDGRGERFEPVEIRRIHPITAVIGEFFPYIHPYYGMSYHLRFSPLAKNGDAKGPLKLVFTSVIGKVVLDFDGH